MPFHLIVRGGTVFTPAGRVQTDVGIEDGRIVVVGDLSSAEANEVIDARNLWVFPGLIDTQVHFREPGLEHKETIETGTRAAVAGGVTTVFEMPNTDPTTTDAEVLRDKLRRAEATAWSRIAFFVGASATNADLLAELEMLPGTPGVKIFMGSSTGSLLVETDDDLRRVLKSGVRRCPIHAEDEPRNRANKSRLTDPPHPRQHPNLRDAESARLATERILRLSAETGRPVHVLHISTADELPLLAAAKEQGLGTTCEVTPQHLWFAAPDCYDRLGTFTQMNPPIRSEKHREELWKAVQAGLFDVFGSDHAPHTRGEKAKTYPASPSGMPGVQTMLYALLTFVAQGKLPAEQLVQMACQTPADLYGLVGKGRIEPGYDADFVLVDPTRRTLFGPEHVVSKCGWSPYDGETFVGAPLATFIAGVPVWREGEFLTRPTWRNLRFSWKPKT